MKAAIVIDNWKLDIFTRHLTQSGYKFEQSGALTPESLVLSVETDDMRALADVILAATKECKDAQ